MQLDHWEPIIQKRAVSACPYDGVSDPAHDETHLARVVATAKSLAQKENARLDVVVPAAWLHDIVNIRKDDPRRSKASLLSAEAAAKFLLEIGYPSDLIPQVSHAIHAHSFSAGVEPLTVEAKVVQDADRLDAIGAIGIARCFTVGGQLRRPLYHPEDPFAVRRPADDSKNSVDHFYCKLLKLRDQLKTEAGKGEAERRTAFMVSFLEQLNTELPHL